MLGADAAAHQLERPILVTTAGAPPPPAVIARTEALGFRINHVYGLTETYGPITICEWNAEWDELDADGARPPEGAAGTVACVTADAVRVVDDEMNDVPADGETMGEVVMRGNNVMKGYFADEAATAEAFRGGWFHSGDLARHAPGRLHRAPRPREGHHHLGRREHLHDRGRARARRATRTCSRRRSSRSRTRSGASGRRRYVTLRPARELTEEELIAFSRETLPGFKAPSAIEFGELPKTSTGKVKKFELRERARAAAADQKSE